MQDVILNDTCENRKALKLIPKMVQIQVLKKITKTKTDWGTQIRKSTRKTYTMED